MATELNEVLKVLNIASGISRDIQSSILPPQEGRASRTQDIVMGSLVKGTRTYIEKIANQANGCYESGWYDACAVMVRRLLETLIIESFEKHGISENIKNTSGDFLFLGDLIQKTISETAWNIGRNCKKSIVKLKDIGDKSAHSRRYLAHRDDLDRIKPDIRVVVQELVLLAGLK